LSQPLFYYLAVAAIYILMSWSFYLPYRVVQLHFMTVANMEISAYVDERLPSEVVGDAARLRQVLLNLAGNAIKFTTTGGVALIVEPGICPNEISFLVRDTGIGIAPDAQQRIFREFEQADDRIARSYGGTGLGLSISERIVKRMGGRITLVSQLGVGSTFEVSIPLPASDGEQKPSATADLTGQHIMLVTPQSIEASLVALRLQRWGAQTCMAGDGAVARALLPERTWHAVLIDRALGAAEVASLGEAARMHATQRIVMFTPADRRELQPAAASSSRAFTGYLIKPVRAASLAARFSTDDFTGEIKGYVGQGSFTDDTLNTFGGVGVVDCAFGAAAARWQRCRAGDFREGARGAQRAGRAHD